MPLPGWVPARLPGREPLRGAHVLLRPVDAAADAADLFAASHPPQGDVETWSYLPYGPYASVEELRQALETQAASDDPRFVTLLTLPDERPAGIASYLRMEPEHGVIEIGHVWLGATLRRTTAATEAMYLLARNAFDGLGHRRLEWKCNALNAASCSAAERLGFTFEGVFRQHLVVKGRNRDTAWYAITDGEWPAIRAGFEAWLAPENRDASGGQVRSLRELMGEAQGRT